MARPQKIGLDYFPLDVNFYGDIKIRRLMRNNGGGKAAFVYITLLCKIYESGYYMAWDDDMSFMLSDITGFEEGMIRESIKSCLQFGLLDKDLFDSHAILTSKGIQSRYLSATRRRVETVSKLPYIYPELLDEFLHSETDNEKEFMSTETPLMLTETELLSTESTRKKSKGNNNSSLRSELFVPSTSTTTCVRKSSEKKKVLTETELLSTETGVQKGILSTETKFLHTETPLMSAETVNAVDVIEKLKCNRDWLLQMQRRHGLAKEKIIGWLNAFNLDCNVRGKQIHENESDVMQHFNDWLLKQLKPKKGDKQPGVSQPSVPELWNKAHAELCMSVPPELSNRTFDLIRFDGYQDTPPTLTVLIPSNIFDVLESEPCINSMRTILPKYFGREIKLLYKFSDSNQENKDSVGKSQNPNPS